MWNNKTSKKILERVKGMEAEKRIDHQNNVVSIDKESFMKIVAETMSEMSGPEPETLEEIIQHVLWVKNTALFASILTHNVFDGD